MHSERERFSDVFVLNRTKCKPMHFKWDEHEHEIAIYRVVICMCHVYFIFCMCILRYVFSFHVFKQMDAHTRALIH
jgi:hypothetical protein